VVSPRPRVSRPQAGRCRGGRSGGFGWWALRKLDHPGSAGAGLRGLPGFPAAGMSWAARAIGASFSSWGGRIRELSRGRRVLGCGSRSVRGGAAPGCREIRCPLDNEPSGGVGATSFFGFVTHPYAGKIHHDHGDSGMTVTVAPLWPCTTRRSARRSSRYPKSGCAIRSGCAARSQAPTCGSWCARTTSPGQPVTTCGMKGCQVRPELVVA
jgi:hypothetical protein